MTPVMQQLLPEIFALSVLHDETVHRKKIHHNYDQVQMQLALSGCKWCDVIVYTLKGLVIDRVYFDQDHWVKLMSRINHFYFRHFLPTLAKGQTALFHSIKTKILQGHY